MCAAVSTLAIPQVCPRFSVTAISWCPGWLLQGTGLIDLMTPIGELACKVPPSVDLAKTMGKLTGTLKNLE